MQTLRTPDDRFAGLTDFGYPPHYADVPDGDGGTLRMAWVEDGPADAPVVLLLHGEPSWSYLYRTMMPPLVAAGLRVVAPDLVGFGRSDKPAAIADHSYARHVEWVRALVFDALDLQAVTLVGQDWGGLIGLRLAAEHPERFARIVASNTGLPTGDQDMPEVWHRFRVAMQDSPEIDIARFVASGCRRGLSNAARDAYDAPFPDPSFQAGPRAMPGLVPYRPDDPASEANRSAWAVLTESPTPMLVAFGDSDPITAAMGPILQRTMAGAQAWVAAGHEHPVIADAGHFVQEDAGPELAAAVIDFVRATT
ncbi:haloalkane dehalogenase [Jatrophihabitans endophyticus]|uniref:haloalkane dehalogenase n=1 Tax=Jatrophihabitans endophyticus TaxID=1206085 RepID=UPI0019FE1D4F|nr:haloalkane dehalogenase [Jatrophihabitans endophyticus]MBE7189950.1 haloalkane dehalogenase [Jatrophihabitans endophyticus]